MKNKILYSLILLGYIMTGCNEPENNGFSDVNLENNTYLDIDTRYVSGTNVFIQDIYNGATLNYSLDSIEMRSINVNELKYNLKILPENIAQRCYIYNGVRYFENQLPAPLLYCDNKETFYQNVAEFTNYKMVFDINEQISIPVKPDSFEGFYLEHGEENEMSVMATPVILRTQINDIVNAYINDIKSNQIIESVTNSSPNINGTNLTSEMKIKTKMKIGSMSLLNMITKEIIEGNGGTFPNTFLTSTNGRIGNDFTVQINIKVKINAENDPIAYILVVGVYTDKETFDNVEFQIESANLDKFRKLSNPNNIQDNVN